MNPTVSIVLCTYNGAKYLRAQLDSLLRQSYPVHEIIVQDDYSTDETWEILEEYQSQNSIFKLYRNEEEHGVNGNFLSAMARTTGDYIAICDQDDVWENDKIALQMDAIGDKMMCSGLSRAFSSDGSFAHFDDRVHNTSIFRMLFLCLPGHTLLFRRSLLAELPPLSHPVYRITMYDAVLCIIASAYDSLVFTPFVLVNFRRHTAATTYKDYRRSLPSWRNGLHELLWGIRHYREARSVAVPIYRGKLALLEYINAETVDFIEAKKMMRREVSDTPLDFVRLQILLVRHSRKLFQTEGGGIVKKLRAFLYPVMQLYMYRQS